VAPSPALVLAGVAALTCASGKILSNLFGDSAIYALAIKHQNLFVPDILKWSKDRLG